ncbi:MAG: aldo/keto reductase [Acidobacteriota bacterium]
MNYRTLGGSGIKVSSLCLGTMTFGNRTPEDEAARIVAAARDAGVNFIDTADSYARGESERLTGRLIASDRRHWVLATKVGNPMSEVLNERGLSRRWIMTSVEDSLARLGTDWIDIYYLHLDDPQTPLEQTATAMGDLIRSGKIRYFGMSNYPAWRIAQMIEMCRQLAIPSPIVCQPYYNAMNRMPEVEVLPCCAHYGLGVVPYSPLARGVLTGKYRPGEAPPPESRAGRSDKRMMETEFRSESIALAQTIKTHAEGRGMTAGQFALNWVLNNRLVTSVLVGPRTLEHWREYLGALQHSFTAEDEALVNSLVAPGHPSTPGYSDPRYPITGRVT